MFNRFNLDGCLSLCIILFNNEWYNSFIFKNCHRLTILYSPLHQNDIPVNQQTQHFSPPRYTDVVCCVTRIMTRENREKAIINNLNGSSRTHCENRVCMKRICLSTGNAAQCFKEPKKMSLTLLNFTARVLNGQRTHKAERNAARWT